MNRMSEILARRDYMLLRVRKSNSQRDYPVTVFNFLNEMSIRGG